MNNEYNIKKYPDSVLRKKSEEVKEITEEIVAISQRMVDIMIENNGVGIAAPQVGVLKKIIVVLFKNNNENFPRIFINPKIIKKSKETEITEEGCLSFSNLFLNIKRAKEVEVEALNEKGEKIQIKADGFISRIFQHEIDHLNGILLIDRINFWQKLFKKSNK